MIPIKFSFIWGIVFVLPPLTENEEDTGVIISKITTFDAFPQQRGCTFLIAELSPNSSLAGLSWSYSHTDAQKLHNQLYKVHNRQHKLYNLHPPRKVLKWPF